LVHPPTTGNYNVATTAATTVTANLSPTNFTAGAGTVASNYALPTSASGPGTITAAPALVLAGNPPTTSITGPTIGVRGQPLTYTFAVAGPTQGIVFTINYGDGTSVTTNAGGPSIQLDHVYHATGSFTIEVTAKESNGVVSQMATLPVKIRRRR
jgi:hypothetical protein